MEVTLKGVKSVSSIGISWGYQARPEDEIEKAKRVWDSVALETDEQPAAEAQEDKSEDEERSAADEALRAAKAAAKAQEAELSTFATKMSLTADLLLFTERLQVVRDGDVCGTVTLSTERMHDLPSAKQLYSSHVTGPDYSVMALVEAWTLQTSTERRQGPGDCSTFMTNYDGSLHVVVRSSKDAEPIKWVLSKEVSACLLGEGASLMLIRHLGVSRYVGRLSLYALLDGDGGLALQTLTAMRGSSDDDSLVVRRVSPLRRDLPEFTVECGVTRAGELLWYTRSPGEWWVRTDPRSRLYMTMRLGRSLPPLQSRWREDAQLVSLYESRVELLTQRYKRRLQELRPLLADFLLALLNARPVNAFSFAVDYFTAQTGSKEGDERHDSLDGEEPTAGLQYADALFYFERETRRQDAMAKEEEATKQEATVGSARESAAQEVGAEAEEREGRSADGYLLARGLLSQELTRALRDQQWAEHERRETRRVMEERQLRASLFEEAGFAELLVSDTAAAAVDEVEEELHRRRECAFKVHPVSFSTDESVVVVYHDHRYGDDFEGNFHEEL